MSAKVNINVPLSAIAALQQASDPAKTAEAIATITKVVAEQLGARGEADEQPATSPDDETISRRSKKRKRASESPRAERVRYNPSHSAPLTFQVFIKTLTGRTITFEVAPESKVRHVKQWIEDVEGVPVPQQRLIFANKQLDDRTTMDHVSIPADG